MPNKRHPSKKFFGFWGTKYLHQEMLKFARKKKKTISQIVVDAIWFWLKKENDAARSGDSRTTE